MAETSASTCTAFDGARLLVAGNLVDVALAVRKARDNGAEGPILVFDDNSGRVIDLDLRGSHADIAARLQPIPKTETVATDDEGALQDTPKGRGRPKLGVVAREITLLPRQWEWLTTQQGGASVALRKLIDEARKAGSDQDRKKATQERTYRFMSAMAGDLRGFEEAARALFACDRSRMEDETASWPQDIRAHTFRLAFAD